MTTHEVLVAARNRIERGWGQGNSAAMGEDGKYCAFSALGVEMGLELRSGGVLRVTEIRRSEPGRLLTTLSGDTQVEAWNDEPGRTKEEVLALFDKAIAETAPQPDVSFLAREAVRA